VLSVGVIWCDTQPHEELLFRVKKLDRFEHRSQFGQVFFIAFRIFHIYMILAMYRKNRKREMIYQFFRTHLTIQTFWVFFISGDVKPGKTIYSILLSYTTIF